MSLAKLLTEDKKIPKLGELRDEIDRIDREIVELLAERTEIVLEIGDIKDKYNASTVQKNRWQQVLDKIERLSNSNDLNPKDVKRIWNAIHKQSVNAQNEYREQ